jgi:hypothetical protein
MSNRFVIAIDECTPKEQLDFLQFCRDKNLSWWNWIEGFWLIVDPAGTLSADKFRDFIHDTTGGKRALVMQIDKDVTWAGSGPDTSDKNMFRWLKDRWTGPDVEKLDETAHS